MKYRVEAYLTYNVGIDVDAENEEEAKDKAATILGGMKVPDDMDGRLDTEYEVNDPEDDMDDGPVDDNPPIQNCTQEQIDKRFAEKIIKQDGVCISCRDGIDRDGMTEIEVREFCISGLCENCQREIFRRPQREAIETIKTIAETSTYVQEIESLAKEGD